MIVFPDTHFIIICISSSPPSSSSAWRRNCLPVAGQLPRPQFSPSRLHSLQTACNDGCKCTVPILHKKNTRSIDLLNTLVSAVTKPNLLQIQCWALSKVSWVRHPEEIIEFERSAWRIRTFRQQCKQANYLTKSMHTQSPIKMALHQLRGIWRLFNYRTFSCWLLYRFGTSTIRPNIQEELDTEHWEERTQKCKSQIS